MEARLGEFDRQWQTDVTQPDHAHPRRFRADLSGQRLGHGISVRACPAVAVSCCIISISASISLEGSGYQLPPGFIHAAPDPGTFLHAASYSVPVLALIALSAPAQTRPAPPQVKPIRLLIQGDDMGAAHGMNAGTIKAYKEGILRSTNVIVPGPWFMEAVELLQQNPGLDVACTCV